jgi:hypothetical protein
MQIARHVLRTHCSPIAHSHQAYHSIGTRVDKRLAS